MTDDLLTDEELSQNYGVGYSLMLKMGWSPHSQPSCPVFSTLNKNKNTESRRGLGFVREENIKLDTEFEDMMMKMSSLTTKMPNSKAKTVSEGDSKISQYITIKAKQRSSSKSRQCPQSIVQKSEQKVLDSPNLSGFKANCSWDEVEEPVTAVSENCSVLQKPKISMKLKPRTVLKNKLSEFE
ncbi:hypothetical protein ACHWQZ_G018244 [Mnemiopsis leidyi]